MNEEIGKAFVKAKDALDEATEDLLRAQNRAEAARREETNCLNRVNEAQKEFDKILSAYRGEAPRGTDWKSAKGESV